MRDIVRNAGSARRKKVGLDPEEVLALLRKMEERTAIARLQYSDDGVAWPKGHVTAPVIFCLSCRDYALEYQTLFIQAQISQGKFYLQHLQSFLEETLRVDCRCCCIPRDVKIAVSYEHKASWCR